MRAPVSRSRPPFACWALWPASRCAGADLEQSHLLGSQRRLLLLGVLLIAREQAPEQHRQLARHGGDRYLMAAAGAQALIEGVHRPGLWITLRAVSTSAQRTEAEPRLEIRPPLAGELPYWRRRQGRKDRPPAGAILDRPRRAIHHSRAASDARGQTPRVRSPLSRGARCEVLKHELATSCCARPPIWGAGQLRRAASP